MIEMSWDVGLGGGDGGAGCQFLGAAHTAQQVWPPGWPGGRQVRNPPPINAA